MSKMSAVIVMYDESTDSLILTQRSTDLRDHPGEICFPGGSWQVGDADLWVTALRELFEELGIDASRINLVKKLTPEKTLKGSIIQPWLTTISSLQPYTANVREVAAVLALPMHQVMMIDNYKDFVIKRQDIEITSCQFTGSSYFVWGATARIMKQLCMNC